MSYFDDNENRIVYGGRRAGKASREKIARAALAAPPGSDRARARTAAHAAFDPLWQSGHFTRGVAYEWLASMMGLPVDLTHMVLFDEEQCQHVVDICMAHPARQKAAAADFEDLDK